MNQLTVLLLLCSDEQYIVEWFDDAAAKSSQVNEARKRRLRASARTAKLAIFRERRIKGNVDAQLSMFANCYHVHTLKAAL